MLKFGDTTKIKDVSLDEQVLSTSQNLIPCFAGFANYLVSPLVPLHLSFHQRNKFMPDVKKFFWIRLICIVVVLMGLFVVVFPRLRWLVLLRRAIHRLLVGIIVVSEICTKS